MKVPEKEFNFWKKKVSSTFGMWFMDKPTSIHAAGHLYHARSAWTLRNEAAVAAANIRKQKRQARVKKTSVGWTVFSR